MSTTQILRHPTHTPTPSTPAEPLVALNTWPSPNTKIRGIDLAAAHLALHTWLHDPKNADLVSDARADFADWVRLDRCPPADRARLRRVCDEWILCDLDWPQTVAMRLSLAAQRRGDLRVAAALRLMHRSQFQLWQVFEDTPDGRYLVMLNGPGGAETYARAPSLTGDLPFMVWLAGRLWPAGSGEWTFSAGVLPYAAAPEVAATSEVMDTVDAVGLQMTQAMVQAGFWAVEQAGVRERLALLPAA